MYLFINKEKITQRRIKLDPKIELSLRLNNRQTAWTGAGAVTGFKPWSALIDRPKIEGTHFYGSVTFKLSNCLHYFVNALPARLHTIYSVVLKLHTNS
jgi:hypothetical protein